MPTSSIDAGYADWLKAPALWSSTANGSLPAGLDASARESEIISPLVTKAAADSEGGRQMGILGSPVALDPHVVKGQRRDLIGKAVTLRNDLLGYSAGIACFVVGADEREDNTTVLKVVRKLT